MYARSYKFVSLRKGFGQVWGKSEGGSGAGLRRVWGRSEAVLGQVWGRSWVGLGQVWGRSGAVTHSIITKELVHIFLLIFQFVYLAAQCFVVCIISMSSQLECSL